MCATIEVDLTHSSRSVARELDVSNVTVTEYQVIQLSRIPEKDAQMDNPGKRHGNAPYKNLEDVKGKYTIQKQKHPMVKVKNKSKRLKTTKKQIKKEKNGSETVSENDDWIPKTTPKKRNVGRKKSQDNTADSEKKKPVKKRKPKVQNNEVEKKIKIKKEKEDDPEENDMNEDLDFRFDNSDYDENKFEYM
ncbi:unnamed protein product [Diabrotica balteata]|uniref:Uncharacterized protein n=1 Tax=Diabrotica balteata TaxID=107213 RepID=A0A9N9TCZ5_DIABA|nr:unnamed protein product [Diabrotica balteata]